MPNKDYEAIMRRIMTVRPKKRKNWKGTFVDTKGVHSKLRYDGTDIINLDKGEWIKIKPASEIFGVCSNLCEMPSDAMLVEQVPRLWDMDKFFYNTVATIKEETHTGNHVPHADRASSDKVRHDITRAVQMQRQATITEPEPEPEAAAAAPEQECDSDEEEEFYSAASDIADPVVVAKKKRYRKKTKKTKKKTGGNANPNPNSDDRRSNIFVDGCLTEVTFRDPTTNPTNPNNTNSDTNNTDNNGND